MTRVISAIVMIATCVACSSQTPHPDEAQVAATTWVGPVLGRDSVIAATNAYHDNRAAIADGQKYFHAYNCSGCHGDHGGGGMGPSLRDSLWYYGGDDPRIYASISQGRDKGMPAWGARLTPDQIWKLVAYITSMRTSNEPDPPR